MTKKAGRAIIHDSENLCSWRVWKNISGILLNYGTFLWRPRVTCKRCLKKKASKPNER